MNDHFGVVLAAMLHDIGKFFERGELLGEYRQDENQTQMDCPLHQDGYRSHKHVLHTRRFCERLAEIVSMLEPEEYQRTKTADQHWINLAVRHHVAVGAPLEVLVQQADHLASAEREEGKYYEQRIHQKTLLEPMLARVNLQSKVRHVAHRLPLKAGHAFSEDIYPQDDQSLNLTGNHARLTRQQLTPDYAELGNALLDDLKNIPQPASCSYESVCSIIRSLLSLFEYYLCQIPAATNILHPDISLFDHLRITAAIAESLYIHHQHHDTMDIAALHHHDKTKWRLVCGDFSGIQSFIYRITSKGAAKALRGRSLYIQLLCDAVSEYLMRSLELLPTARIYSSGGKFYLLIADVLEEQLRREAERVNAWLLEEFGGEVYLGIGMAKVTGADFKGGAMSVKWREANEDLLASRNRRFAGQMAPDFFAPQKVLDKGTHCKVCGRSDQGCGLENDQCRQCRELEELGRCLADTTHIFWHWGDERPHFSNRPLSVLPFDGLGCRLYLLDEQPQFSALVNLAASGVERINHPDCMDGNQQGYACGYRWMGKWDRKKISGEWEFDTFADAANGIKRLGVLRMDVDNLGQLFIRGFRWADDDSKVMGSLSRVATLSRQLHIFFSGHLMHLLADEDRVQVIYAGGDDLFLIGSWDALPEVGRRIQQAFSQYAANNHDFTISGGMVAIRGKYPIAHAAELAGEAEEKAKQLTRKIQKGDVEKSAFCMFDTPIGWEDFEAVQHIRQQLIQTTETNKAILGRMRQVVLAQQEYQRRYRLHRLDECHLAELVQWQKWRWQLVYNLHRFEKRNSELKPQLDAIRNAVLSNKVTGKGSDLPVIDWLQLPTRWAEFLTREVT